jgi:hypothetical protein
MAEAPPLIIAIVGAESTGKTTLAAGLADRLSSLGMARVAWVAETLRDWCAAHGRTPRRDEQAGILQAQSERIAAAAANHEVVVCDTTALMTAVYSRLVFGDRSRPPRRSGTAAPQKSQPTSTSPRSAIMAALRRGPGRAACRATRSREQVQAKRGRPRGSKRRSVSFPEQAVQDGVGVQRQQFLARQRGGQHGDAVVVLVAADLVLVAPRPPARLPSPCTGRRWISRPAATWSSAASTSRVSSCSDCSM